jgi:hypothetical protein
MLYQTNSRFFLKTLLLLLLGQAAGDTGTLLASILEQAA